LKDHHFNWGGRGGIMSKKNIVVSLSIFLVICAERIIQVINVLSYPTQSFENEYLKDQVLIFIANYLPFIVIPIGLIYLALTLKREKVFSAIPLAVSLVTLLFFSQFDIFSSYVSTNFDFNYSKYRQVIELIKKEKLKLVEDYPVPPSTYWNSYPYYGKVMNYSYALPKNYNNLSKDYSNQSNIDVVRSEKKGLIQVEFHIIGNKFAYIYAPEGKVFTSDSTIESMEKRKPDWYYVVWK
jgi:hypothetical protein